MMMTLDEAHAIMREARSKFGRKTLNKVYGVASQEESPAMIAYDDLAAATNANRAFQSAVDPTSALHQQLQKAIDRNTTREDSRAKKLRDTHPVDILPPYMRGEIMCQRADTENMVGNCAEQACVAVYLVLRKDPQAGVWFVTIAAPGDHAFVVVGPATEPAWPTVAGMTTAADTDLVIDPWLNLACQAKTYPTCAADKLRKWLAESKRIYWKGNDGKTEGWYQPGGDYAARFQDSKLEYVKCATR
jgi:hypothetical protein